MLMKDAGHIAVLAAATLLAGCADCPDSFRLTSGQELRPGQRVVLEAPDGRLRIEGRERSTALEIGAAGCSAGGDARVDIDGGADEVLARVVAATADVRVRVPTGLAIEVRHGDGDARVLGTGPLTLLKGSGRTRVEQVIGDVRVITGDDALHVQDVLGDVDVVDGSGAIYADRVGGTLRVRDGAGGIHARDVEGDVVIESDGSGTIEVRRVRGDFVVRAKTDDRRMIRYDSVSGSTRLPSDLSPP